MARIFYIEQQLYKIVKQIFIKIKNFINTELNTVNNTINTTKTNLETKMAIDINTTKTNLETKMATDINTAKTDVQDQINESNVLVVTGTKTQASQSFSVGMTNVTSDMVCIHSELGTPSAQLGDWTVITGNGTLTINGEVAEGGSTFTLYLIPKRT